MLAARRRSTTKPADFDGDGRAELLVTSPWGIGILELSGGTLGALTMAANGTRLGGWIVDTTSNRFGPAADYDGDGRAELLMSSPWGIGTLELNRGALTSPLMAANGTRVAGWVVDTRNNRYGPAADYDGDGRAELIATSPWGLGVLEPTAPSGASPVMARNGTRFGGWNLQTDDNRFGVRRPCFEHTVVHFKTLIAPTAAINTFMDTQYKAIEWAEMFPERRWAIESWRSHSSRLAMKLARARWNRERRRGVVVARSRRFGSKILSSILCDEALFDRIDPSGDTAATPTCHWRIP